MKFSGFLYILLSIFPVFADDLKFSWSLTYPGQASGIIESADSAFIIGGSKLLKLNAQGEIVWEKDASCQIMGQSSDGNILAVYGNEIVKMNTDGEVEWSTPGGFPSIQQTFDGGYIVAGTTYNEFPPTYYSNREILFARYSNKFELEWSKVYSYGDLHDYGFLVMQTSDSNYVIGGRILDSDDNPHSYGRGILIKIDSVGNVIWERQGGIGNTVYSMTETSDHSILCASQLLSDTGPTGAYLHLFTKDGEVIWCSDGYPHKEWSVYNRKTYYGDVISDGIETRQGTFIGVGTRGYRVWILELDADGWEKNDFTWGDGCFNSIIQTKVGDYVLAGVNQKQAYIARFQIVPASNDINMPANPPKGPEHFALYQNYPNPFNAVSIIRFALPRTSRVELTLHNILGRQIAVLLLAERPRGEHELQLDARNLASGVYWYRLKTEGFTDIKKIVVLK